MHTRLKMTAEEFETAADEIGPIRAGTRGGGSLAARRIPTVSGSVATMTPLHR